VVRIRTIKPEIFRHEILWELEKETGLPCTLIFMGLFCCADREGRFKWRPRELKLDIRPYDDGLDFGIAMDILFEAGLITKYEVDGEPYGLVTKFSSHQVVNHREAESRLPAPPGVPGRAPGVPGRARGEGKGTGRELEGKGKGTGEEGVRKKRSIHPDVQEVFDHWCKCLNHPASTLTKQRQDRILQRIKEGFSTEDLKKAITGCSLTPHNMGINERGEVYDSVMLILKDADQVERFMRNADAPPRAPSKSEMKEARHVETAREFLGRAKGGGS
jgi:hypothetical protein